MTLASGVPGVRLKRGFLSFCLVLASTEKDATASFPLLHFPFVPGSRDDLVSNARFVRLGVKRALRSTCRTPYDCWRCCPARTGPPSCCLRAPRSTIHSRCVPSAFPRLWVASVSSDVNRELVLPARRCGVTQVVWHARGIWRARDMDFRTGNKNPTRPRPCRRRHRTLDTRATSSAVTFRCSS